jgi:hypothetical protein
VFCSPVLFSKQSSKNRVCCCVFKKMDKKPDKTWTIVRLKAYLRENGGRLSGNKADLLRLAILYADD